MAEAGASMTPGPEYKIPHMNVFKKRTMSVKFESKPTNRLDPIKRSESTDFFETSLAMKHTIAKAPVVGFLKGQKKSFAEEVAKKNMKIPGVGAYKISDRAYKMLSPSPTGRKR